MILFCFYRYSLSPSLIPVEFVMIGSAVFEVSLVVVAEVIPGKELKIIKTYNFVD